MLLAGFYILHYPFIVGGHGRGRITRVPEGGLPAPDVTRILKLTGYRNPEEISGKSSEYLCSEAGTAAQDTANEPSVHKQPVQIQ